MSPTGRDTSRQFRFYQLAAMMALAASPGVLTVARGQGKTESPLAPVDYTEVEKRALAHMNLDLQAKPRHSGKREAARRLRQMEKLR